MSKCHNCQCDPEDHDVELRQGAGDVDYYRRIAEEYKETALARGGRLREILKNFTTSELQEEITRRGVHLCPSCAALQAQLDAVAEVLGETRMIIAEGYHFEAVFRLMREREHYEKAFTTVARWRDNGDDKEVKR